jgi:hypothetical protein
LDHLGHNNTPPPDSMQTRRLSRLMFECNKIRTTEVVWA